MRRIAALLALSALAASLLALTGCGSDTGSGGTAAEAQPVELTLFVRTAQPSVGESFEIGQPVRIKDSGTLLGEITDVQVEGSLSAVPNAEGELNASRSPVLVDVFLTVEGEAVVDETGYRFGGERVYINNDIKYLTPLTQFGGIITELKTLDG